MLWQAMRLLYIMSTADGWQSIMYRMMDATDDGVAPQRNDYGPVGGGAAFCVIWMMVGSFFAINLFIGAVVDSFNRLISY